MERTNTHDMQASIVAMQHAAAHAGSHQYAIRVSDGASVYAGTEDKSRKEEYKCFCPDGPHPLILRQSSGRDDVGDYTANFAHHPGTKCRGNCGESEEHIGGKHNIRNFFMVPGRYITILEEVCHSCKAGIKHTTYASDTHKVALEVVSCDKKWRYDTVLVRRDDGARVQVIEVVKTHYSSQEKLESTRMDGLPIAEIKAADVFANVKAGYDGWELDHQCLKKDRKFCDKCGLIAAKAEREEAERKQQMEEAERKQREAVREQREAARKHREAVREVSDEDRRYEYRAANYKPPVFMAPTNDTELWRSVTNGLTIVCVKPLRGAGGTRTYVEKNDAFKAMEAAYADGL